METTNTTDRDDAGRFTFTGNYARLCRCGHALGVHTAGAPHTCLNGDRYAEGATGEACDCTKFRPVRRAR